MHRILIIEDDATLRGQLARILQFEGFEPLEAADGKSGVAMSLQSPPDLVVCDIMMPELDGFGVLQALREHPATTMVPFIFVTALAAIRDRRHGMEEGADDYITKPYDPDALVRSVRRRLERRSRQIEEGRLRAEEVSLAAAAALPSEITDTLEHITTLTNLLALKHAAQDPQIAATHESVARASARLRRMLRRLHLYAQLPQLYAHRFDLVRTGTPASAAAVLERVALEVCRTWKREEDLELKPDPARLPMREEYLVVLIEELVDNACKFSAPGSPVEVTGQARREFWSLTVHSRGTGMSPGQIAQIAAFKQFWQGNKRPRGLGLGLALAQGIARLHGCEFAVDSDSEETEVNILVPLEY